MSKQGSIADHDCVFNGKKLPTDAHGNNAAFSCPFCGHAVLIVSGPVDTHGWLDCKNPSKCRNCERKYRVKDHNKSTAELHIEECNE